jgi:glucuronoarabinoxylan endo-1,4-beta-xylanase
MVAAVRVFREEAGIELAGIGLQNEPYFHEPYASAILDARRFVELIKVTGARFEREGIRTPLFMPEEVFSQTASMNRYLTALNADAAAQRYCPIVAVHGYDEQGRGEARPDFPQWAALWKRAQAGAGSKELWMTETYPGFKDWGSALGYAVTLYGSLEFGNIGLWTSWGIEGQLLSQGAPNAAWYACSQFYRWVRPGAVRLGAASADPEVLATAYLNDAAHGGKLACVLINRADAARAVRLKIGAPKSGAKLAVSRTDRVSRRAAAGVPEAGGVVLLPPRSVSTVYEE